VPKKVHIQPIFRDHIILTFDVTSKQPLGSMTSVKKLLLK